MSSPSAAAVVELAAVTKSFHEGDRRHLVLDRADLRVRAGSFTVVLGRSGTGKSTLLNLVSGIDRPDAGEIRVAGEPLHEMNERERTLFRRRHIGFVFQFFNLVPTLTVLENLLLPLELLHGPRAEQSARALEMLDRVGLADRAGSFPDRLSGGEQQRVATARALVHDPDLLLADEPTGNLDPEIGAAVMDLLDDLVRARRRTLLVATHSHQLATRADRVLRIDNYRLVEADRGPS